MMNSKKYCCVPGCRDRAAKRHRFPKDREICNMWLENLNNPKLFGKTPEELNNSYVVCHQHFDDKFKNCPSSNRMLQLGAIPTLFLPENLLVLHPPSVEEELVRPPMSLDIDLPAISQDKHRFRPLKRSVKLSHKKASLLKRYTSRRGMYLTETEQLLYHDIKYWSRKTVGLMERVDRFQSRLNLAEKCSSAESFQRWITCINEPTYRFFVSQVENQKLKPRGRRFTLEDKILALSLFKASGKGYKLLSKIFALPATNTLTKLLSKLPFLPGINVQMFEILKNSIEKLPDKDKCCILMFDEIHLQPNVNYNQNEDIIEGISTTGQSRSPHLADHAIVFFLKGVHRQWKQPLCFYFSNGPIKSLDLKNLIKEVASTSLNYGFKVVATVCDQYCAAAINLLLKDTAEDCLRERVENKYLGFKINGTEIIPLFDFPHLIKGFRNNLITKNLHYKIINEDATVINKIAKWSHIEAFYYVDTQDMVRMCPKLTDEHVLPNKIKKMKVSCCTQLMSYQVGSLMKRLSMFNILDAKAVDTAEFILFLDELFDSVNANSKIGAASKPLKSGVTKQSDHFKFWSKSVKLLNNMKFFSSSKNTLLTVPTLTNTIFTLKRLPRLCNELLDNKQFDYVLTRTLQQDALENFFGLIRSQKGRNVTPSVNSFQSSFKSLIVTNFMARRSIYSNCEEDETCGALYTFKDALKNEVPLTHRSITTPEIPNLPNLDIDGGSFVEKNTVTYLSGYFMKRIKKTVKCKSCMKNVKAWYELVKTVDFIDAREYPNSELQRPGSAFNFSVYKTLSYLFFLIPRLCHATNLSVILQEILSEHGDFKIFNCNLHMDTGSTILKIIIQTTLHFWCKSVNRIAHGKDSKFEVFMRSNTDLNKIDPIKVEALNMYLKKLKKKNRPV